MNKFQKLTRDEMRNLLGGNPPPEGGGHTCAAAIICSNNQQISGRADCSDESSGSDSDIECGLHYPGTYSISCECS